MEQKATMNMKEAATYIGVCYNTLSKMCLRGEVPFFYVGAGRIRRFCAAELDEWMHNKIMMTMNKPKGYGKIRAIN